MMDEMALAVRDSLRGPAVEYREIAEFRTVVSGKMGRDAGVVNLPERFLVEGRANLCERRNDVADDAEVIPRGHANPLVLRAIGVDVVEQEYYINAFGVGEVVGIRR